jgi:hypothetical protein
MNIFIKYSVICYAFIENVVKGTVNKLFGHILAYKHVQETVSMDYKPQFTSIGLFRRYYVF